MCLGHFKVGSICIHNTEIKEQFIFKLWTFSNDKNAGDFSTFTLSVSWTAKLSLGLALFRKWPNKTFFPSQFILWLFCRRKKSLYKSFLIVGVPCFLGWNSAGTKVGKMNDSEPSNIFLKEGLWFFGKSFHQNLPHLLMDMYPAYS